MCHASTLIKVKGNRDSYIDYLIYNTCSFHLRYSTHRRTRRGGGKNFRANNDSPPKKFAPVRLRQYPSETRDTRFSLVSIYQTDVMQFSRFSLIWLGLGSGLCSGLGVGLGSGSFSKLLYFRLLKAGKMTSRQFGRWKQVPTVILRL